MWKLWKRSSHPNPEQTNIGEFFLFVIRPKPRRQKKMKRSSFGGFLHFQKKEDLTRSWCGLFGLFRGCKMPPIQIWSAETPCHRAGRTRTNKMTKVKCSKNHSIKLRTRLVAKHRSDSCLIITLFLHIVDDFIFVVFADVCSHVFLTVDSARFW